MPKKYQNPKLEVRSDVKRPYYFVRVSVPSVDKKRRRVARVLGFLDEITRKEVMTRRSQALELVNAGRVLLQAQVRFRDLVAQYLEARLPQLGAAAQARYRSHIERHILPTFAERKLSEIEKPAIEAWLTAKERDGFSWWTRQGLRGVLSAIFAAAKDWKLWTGDNPVEGVRIGKKRYAREKRLIGTDDLRLLLAALPEDVRFIVLVIYGTGLSISELLGLRWRNIDFDGGTLTIEQRWYRGDLDVPKTSNRCRRLQIGPLAAEFARRCPGPKARDHFVFLGEDGKTPPDERDLLRFIVRPALKRLGLYTLGTGWHALRRSHIKLRQTIGGATALEAQRAAGHGSLDMTMLYSLPEAERERAQVDRMFDRLLGAGEGKTQ